MNRTGRFAIALAASTALAGTAFAQMAAISASTGTPTGSSNAPVNFTADQMSYDKTGNIVTATGHVRALQNGQTLYADKVSLDRNTNIATATGHVILVQPGGDTVFANQAVLSQGMKNAVMNGVSARLALNARIISNGARRYDGKLDVMTKVIYSACDLCKTDPTHAPLWQIRASSATRDLQHKMIEYRNAEMEMDGIPIFYTPYLTQPDPSVKRQSGFLIPDAGDSSRLGIFTMIPYYYVIDPESDITLTPIIASKQGPAVEANYRRDFNSGILTVKASAGRNDGSWGESIFANGTVDLNQDWRAGFSYNHASNPGYLNNFSILPNASYLTSDVYVEGFSPGAYARLDAETFQGLVSSVDQSELPIVAPHGQYHFVSTPDAIGGAASIDADFFNVERKLGTNTRRISAIPGYSIPFALPFGIVGTARTEVVTAAYNASRLFSQPNFSTIDGSNTGRVQPYGAVFMRLPLVRSAGAYGSQIIEPEVQLVASPIIGTSQNNRIPNEDSLDLEYSDANLFDFNRYPGIDRLEGGTRVDYAMHAAWYFPQGSMIDGMLGQSYRFHKDDDYLPESGLTDNVSDYVAHLILAPTPQFNITYRTRLSHTDLGARMIDATANFVIKKVNLSGGYLYTNTNPYVLYDIASTTSVTQAPPAAYFTPRHEFTANASTSFGQWNVGGGVERNLQTGKFDTANANAGWQNDCFGVSLLYFKRFTSFNLDDGSTTVLLQFTFKTLGNVGFSAL
jgi:LPS-assembly protein